MDDFRSDLAGAAIGTMTGGAGLIVHLLSSRNRLTIARERIVRAGRSTAALSLGRQNCQGKDNTNHQNSGQTADHGFFSAAAARSGRPKVRILVPDAIARN